MRRLLAAALVLLAAPEAQGQVVSDAPVRAAVTIYRDGPVVTDDDAYEDVRSTGLAFISETRTVDLPAGRSRISFRGVADTMVPQSAAIEGLPGAVVERNQDYSLLSPGTLIDAYLNRPVRVIRTDPATGRVTERAAIVRTGAQGPILEVDGRFEPLRCSGAPERLVFDGVPESLSDKPTFSVLADAPQAGRYTVKLSYLATGFNWSANYVATLADDGRSLDLIGWLTLANRTSATFGQAPTDVVAGELSRDEDTVPPEPESYGLAPRCWPAPLRPAMTIPPLPAPSVQRRAGFAADGVEEIVVTAQRIARQSDLGDYKLYTLPEPTTVAARQTKQVLFLKKDRVPVERVYVFRLDDWEPEKAGPQAPDVVLRLANEKARGLGLPLPSGAVAVMEPGPDGALVLAGENAVKDTPVGLPLEVVIGRAMDVSVTARVSARERARAGMARISVEVEIANDKPHPIVLEYRQPRLGDDFRIERASRRAGTRAGEPMWTFRLAAGERASLSYQMLERD